MSEALLDSIAFRVAAGLDSAGGAPPRSTAPAAGHQAGGAPLASPSTGGTGSGEGEEHEETAEERKQRRLASIAARDSGEAPEEAAARRERFLQAREEALARAPPSASTPAASSTAPAQPRGAVKGDARKSAFSAVAAAAAAAENSSRTRTANQGGSVSGGIGKAPLASSQPPAAQFQSSWLTEEQYKEYGYPEVDPRFRDKEWHRKQMELDMTDPRHNPNLKRDQNDPEFWYSAARRPFSKVLLRSEQHWEDRRELWIRQYAQVQDMNVKRELLADFLEECPNDTKRLLGPIMKYAITTTVLGNMVERALHFQKGFQEILEEPENREILQDMRRRLDAGGEAAAEDLLQAYDAQRGSLAEGRAREVEAGRSKERQVADIETLAALMNWAQKCKKDGIVEWEQGNWAEAHASWRQGDETLKRYQASQRDESANKLVFDLHAAILKNLSQACIKLGYWTDALQAAESAIQLQPEDHKAWFRKACALEGMGRFDEAEEALQHVDECAVGRADRERVSRDTHARRERLKAHKEKEEAAGRRMLGLALERGVFGVSREDKLAQGDEAGGNELPKGETKKKPRALQLSEDTRTKLTAEGAQHLLQELTEAYRDPGFQKQIFKLARDVNMNKHDFLANLKQVAFPLQKPILQKWGFEPSPHGAQEMTRAIADFTRGERANPRVKARADETTMAMYGCMYDVLTRPAPGPPPGQQPDG